MGNGIPGLQKRKKRIMKMVLFYTLHTTKRRRNMKKQGFGTTKDGKEALLYTLSNKNGMEISVTDYGAHLVSVLVPDKDGKKRDVVLGFDSVTGYETDGHKFIPMAREKGAACVLCETPPADGGPYVRVADCRAALAQLGRNWYGDPAAQMTMVGVTGTNGKTTTTYLLKEILERKLGAKVGLIGTCLLYTSPSPRD